MPDHYSPRLFLQQIPKKQLQEFFTKREELTELDWNALTEGDPVLSAWHQLPLLRQADVEHWFRAIATLATKEGLRTVIDECQYHKVELPESFHKLRGIHEKIFWIYLAQEKAIISAVV